MRVQAWRLMVVALWHLHQWSKWAEARTFTLYDDAQQGLRRRAGAIWLPHTRIWWRERP